MVVAVLIGFAHIHQKPCQVETIGRRTDLVIDYPDFIMGLAHIDHGLNEILTVQTEHPCNTDDKVLLQRVRNRQLAFQLGLTVDVQGLIVLAVRLPRLRSLAIEHIVCGQI